MDYEALKDFAARVQEITMCITDAREKAIFEKAVSAVNPADVARFQNDWRTKIERKMYKDKDGVCRAPLAWEFGGSYCAPFKYADIAFWLWWRARWIVELDLDRTALKKILDIGVGPGHFCALANVFGHTTVGIDIKDPFYADMCNVLRVDRREEPVYARQAMADLGMAFDLVTIMWQSFDIHTAPKDSTRLYWQIADWEFLLRDLACNQLVEQGRIFIRLNPQVIDGIDVYDHALIAWCADKGARVTSDTGEIDFMDISALR